MSRNRRRAFPENTVTVRLWATVWKRAALVVMAAAVAIGLMGCSMDDLLTPFVGDIPFDQDPTQYEDMGVVDNIPTVPDTDSFLDDGDFRPLG